MLANRLMLERIRKICEVLPEAKCEIKNGHGIFTVRKKPFAYFLNNHHGDGIIGIACKVLPGDNTALVAAQPSRFCIAPKTLLKVAGF